MCPNESPGLQDVWGKEFEKLYVNYESKKQFVRQVKARSLWVCIMDSQQETGMPYMTYKDSVNYKSNQKNIGIIKSSNLCVEIMEHTSKSEVAVCNLASLSLPKFVNIVDNTFDHDALYDITCSVVENLNAVIDKTFYPVNESEVSNIRHRPVAVGVQGLADVFIRMNYPYESENASKLNIAIFETIYFAALSSSCKLAEKNGHYSTFKGSPASNGILQYDLWNVVPSNRWNWNGLKNKIKKFGLRNSLLVALMPTASTSQILGNTESFEPLNSNIYVRKTLAGEFIVINRYLVDKLTELGIWGYKMKQHIISNRGSIQNIKNIPDGVKRVFKTVWEMKMKNLIDMSADRGAYIDQSQSMNCFLEDPNPSKLTSMHFYAHKKGLKTGMYYLRAPPPSKSIQFTVSKTRCNIDGDCISCGS